MVISMERWKGKVAIITGASSGIGAAIVEKLVTEGMRVVGLARRVEKMDELSKRLEGKNGNFYPIKTDVTIEEEILEAFKWVKENLGPVHVLVNNAGIIRKNGLTNGDTQSWRELLDTNVLALCIATREAIKDMRVNNINGHIVHMNSIGGHIVPNFPHLNVYSGTKFAVRALTETLRQELNSLESKIKITSISPGVVKTELVLGCGISHAQLEEWFKGSDILNPEDIGDAVVYVLGTPPHVQVHEMIIRANQEK